MSILLKDVNEKRGGLSFFRHLAQITAPAYPVRMRRLIAIAALALALGGCGSTAQAGSTLSAVRAVRQLLCGGAEALEREAEAYLEAAEAKEREAEEAAEGEE